MRGSLRRERSADIGAKKKGRSFEGLCFYPSLLSAFFLLIFIARQVLAGIYTAAGNSSRKFEKEQLKSARQGVLGNFAITTYKVMVDEKVPTYDLQLV